DDLLGAREGLERSGPPRASRGEQDGAGDRPHGGTGPRGPRAEQQPMCHRSPHVCEPRDAVSPAGLSQRRTKRVIRQGPPSLRCAGAPHVDLRGGRPYRAFMPGEESDPAVLLTPSAVAKVKELRSREGKATSAALRVAVVGGGCSGFSYQLDFDDAPR